MRIAPAAHAAAIALAVAAAYPADAQETQSQQTQASSDQLQEVVVTARYRKEDVQNTPISITALTGDQLEARGYTNVTDVANAAPNVTIEPAPAGYGKSTQAFIRGVGQGDYLYDFEPGIGFYIDDVYFGTQVGSAFDLMDIDRIEIERGPQGTLFGRNSEGGAIRIYSVQPKGDDSGYVEAGYGSYNRERFRGSFDVAIVPDKLFLRVSGGSNEADGYQNIIDFACAHPKEAGTLKATTTAPGCKVGTFGGEDVQAGRFELRALPTDGLEINFSADITDDRSEAAPDKLLAVQPNYPGSGLAAYNALTPRPAFLYPVLGKPINPCGGPVSCFGVPEDSRYITNSPYTTYASLTDPISGISVPNDNTLKSWGGALTIDWDIVPEVHAKSITAYRAYSGEFIENEGGSPTPLENFINFVDHNQTSEEIDLSGKASLLGNDLDWTVGGYYFDEYSKDQGPIYIAALGLGFYADDPVTVDNKSFFVHGVYHITDKLSFEGGYRYTDETKTSTFYRRIIALNWSLPPVPFLPPPGTFLFPVSSATIQTNRSDAKAGFQYQVTPDFSVYTDVATGFKSGGVNPRPFDAAQVLPFGPEDLTAYELGVKSEWFDHRVRFNTAGFISNYKDLQLSAVGRDASGTPSIIVENVGHVLLEGFEAELDAQPLPGLLLDASTGYVDYNILSLGAFGLTPVSEGGPTSASFKPTEIPKWKLSLGAQYSYDMQELGTLTTRLDWSFQSTVFNDVQNTTLLSQPGYGLLNGHVTWIASDPNWSVTLGVTNITGQVYYANKEDYRSTIGIIEGTPGRPREFLATIRRDFGAAAPASPAVPAVAPTPGAAPTPAPVVKTPEPQRQFQVFFDFDKSDITDAAAKVIQAAVDAVKAGNVVKITVTGHTDTVGSAKYNQALSERRAAAVKTALLSDGVSGGEITAVGVGKTGLLVPTADGVREPQNRRAEIVLQ